MSTKNSDISRRQIAKGAAWATPTMIVGAAAPVSAASSPVTPLTGTVSSTKGAQAWYTGNLALTKSSCSTTNPNSGYLDTMCTSSPTSPPNGNGQQNSNNSDGFWLASDTSAAQGTATMTGILATYTFGSPVVIPNCPVGSGSTQTVNSTKWTSCNVLPSGWTLVTALNTSTTTLTLSWSGSTTGTTEVLGQNSPTTPCVGFFINFYTASCSTTSLSVTKNVTFTYNDKTGTGKTVKATGTSTFTGA